MKATSLMKLATLAFCGVLLVSCASPESRIKSSPDVFARLNPDEQALVKQGKVAPGFDMDAVKLALGDPSRVTIHTDATGTHQIWHYVIYEDYQGGIIYAGYYHRYRGWGGPFFYAGGPYYAGYPATIHDRTRIIFTTNNTVAAIEEDQ